jgi:hypothetical protein
MGEESRTLKKLERAVKVGATDSCFVMMPFAAPLGGYYESVYRPAIEKAGLQPVRADAEIFGAGKIMNQVWSGIRRAKVLVAELTSRNPNVFYELGLAHALRKPVVLGSKALVQGCREYSVGDREPRGSHLAGGGCGLATRCWPQGRQR